MYQNRLFKAMVNKKFVITKWIDAKTKQKKIEFTQLDSVKDWEDDNHL